MYKYTHPDADGRYTLRLDEDITSHYRIDEDDPHIINIRINYIATYDIQLIADEHNTIKYINKWDAINDFLLGDVVKSDFVFIGSVDVDDFAPKLLKQYPI